jgi:starch-binding outer membrane protein, SusD/RagB family
MVRQFDNCNGGKLMKKPRFEYSMRRSWRFGWFLVFPILGLLQCTNLDEEPTSVITPENFFKTDQEILGSLASVYAVMRSTTWGYYNLSEISSDEMIVPTRGSDWFDNGRWLEIQRQGWGAATPSGLDDINGAWNDAFRGIARANLLLEALDPLTVSDKATIQAELRGLRAFYYYMLMDFFGGVPIVEDTELKPRARNSRQEVFNFISDELNAIRGDLPASWPATDDGRLTQGAADAILANMYLNAGVFTTETPNATAYNSCSGVQANGMDACDAAIQAADRILNGGVYSLASDYDSPFVPDNAGSPENILVVKFMASPGLGLNFVMRVLHYNQFSPTPWNGFAALAGAYNTYDANDLRRDVWLVGPQVNLDTGQPAFERNGTPLNFTIDIQNETQAGEAEGPRLLKWPPDPNRNAENNGNDFAYFRMGEIYLIKAEAEFENGNAGQALTILNQLRARAFNPDQDLASVDRDVILNERLFELAGEAKRRQDLIRNGKYTAAWDFKQAGGANLVLMPIPQPQIDANPMLTQNAGY